MTQITPATVGDLKRALANVPDDLPLMSREGCEAGFDLHDGSDAFVRGMVCKLAAPYSWSGEYNFYDEEGSLSSSRKVCGSDWKGEPFEAVVI